jgi:anti-sigma B factor antagonist
MEMTRQMLGGVLVLRPEGARLDAAGALAFKEAIRAQMRDHAGRVLLDMERIDFLDSSGLGALVAALKMLDGGRKLELARCGPIVAKVLHLTRMDTVFVLHDRLPSPEGRDAA